jgi:hypothetical protein
MNTITNELIGRCESMVLKAMDCPQGYMTLDVDANKGIEFAIVLNGSAARPTDDEREQFKAAVIRELTKAGNSNLN